MTSDYRPFVPGLPREVRVRRREQCELPGTSSGNIERVDDVYISGDFAGSVVYVRRPGGDEHGSFSEYGWIPLGIATLRSYGLRIKRDAIKLLPAVQEFLHTYDGDDPT